MDKIHALLEEINALASHPAQAVKKFKEEIGKKAIECLPYYCPEEIVYAPGALPVGMWGGQTKLSKVNRYFPAFACSIIQLVMEFLKPPISRSYILKSIGRCSLLNKLVPEFRDFQKFSVQYKCLLLSEL